MERLVLQVLSGAPSVGGETIKILGSAERQSQFGKSVLRRRAIKRKWSSYKGCMVDALAPRGEDGRGVAAKSSGELLTKRGPRDILTGKPGGGHAPPSIAES